MIFNKFIVLVCKEKYYGGFKDKTYLALEKQRNELHLIYCLKRTYKENSQCLLKSFIDIFPGKGISEDD